MKGRTTKEIAKANYDKGLWSLAQLKALRQKAIDNPTANGKLEKEEFKEITGFYYSADTE